MIAGNARSGRASALALLGACLAAAPAHAKTGDLNNNNGIDTGDVRMALQIAAGLANGAGQNATGDVAGPAGNTPDGKISIMDAVRIARAASGLDDLGGGGTPGALAVASMQTVSIAGVTTRNFQLPPGYLLSGTVKDKAGKSITDNTNPFNSTNGSIAFSNAANTAAAPSADVADDATYSAVVAAGTNVATVHTSVFSFDLQSGAFSQYTVAQTPTPVSVVVNGTKTQAFVRPDLPTPGTLTGTISGPVNVTSISFSLDNGGSSSGLPQGGAYGLTSAPGRGVLNIYGTLASNSKVSVSGYLDNAPQTIVSGQTATYNIAVPALANLTGSVTFPAGLTSSYASLANVGAGGFTGYSSTYSMSGSGTYALAVPPGSYSLSFAASAIKSGASTLMWGYNTPVTVAAGTTTRNLTLPAVPATYKVQGVVTGPDGKPVAAATLTAVGSPSGGSTGWYAIGNTTADANGAYSLTLPAGNFTFIINPPDPDSGD